MTELRRILGFVWPYFRRYWLRLCLGVGLGILFGASSAAFVWATKTLIGRYTVNPAMASAVVAEAPEASAPPSAQGRLAQAAGAVQTRLEEALDPWLPAANRALGWREVVGGLLLFPMLAAIRGSVGYAGAYFMAWISERVVHDLRVGVFRKLCSLSLDYFINSSTGDAMTRVSGDTATLQATMSGGFSDLITEPFAILAILTALLLMDWQLTIFVVVFFPLVVVPVVWLGRKARQASRISRRSSVNQASQLVEMLSGIRVIKAFGLEEEQLTKFTRLSKELLHSSLRRRKAKEQANPIIETLAMVGLGVVVIYASYRQTGLDNMAAFIAGVALIYTPVKRLARWHLILEQTVVSVERLAHIMSEQPSVREPAHPLPLTCFESGILFRDVSFGYREHLVLKHLDLEIRRGERIGVAGESGSGKSTLVNLLFRFYDPTTGSIEIDGRDLRGVLVRDLHRLMALVSQEVVLFDLTVAENIGCGRPGATPAEIQAAAIAANAHEFIQSLPHGYETHIGERGATLSGGQRQRVSIARAFVRNAPILVLDEATASLDSAAEAEVQAAIERLEENRTVLCIAHRLSTLASMDRVIVLEEGRVVESGSYHDLLLQDGRFARMAARQGLKAGAMEFGG